MADRLAQVSGHLTNTYGRGLLAGEVAIITGTSSPECGPFYLSRMRISALTDCSCASAACRCSTGASGGPALVFEAFADGVFRRASDVAPPCSSQRKARRWSSQSELPVLYVRYAAAHWPLCITRVCISAWMRQRHNSSSMRSRNLAGTRSQSAGMSARRTFPRRSSTRPSSEPRPPTLRPAGEHSCCAPSC